MPLSNRANSELWDTIIREALIEDCENELKDLNIDLKEHNYSDEFKGAIRKIKFSIGNKTNVRATVKVTKKVLITAAAMMGIMFGGLLTQPDVYAAVQNVIRNVFDTHDKYSYNDNSNDQTLDKELRLGYVPDGYELRTIFYSENDVFLSYESIDEKTINFSYGLASNSTISIDNEQHKYIQFKHGELIFYFYEALNENEYSTLIWYDDNNYYSIDAQLSKEEFVKMADKI